jgi:hypothetical protein
MQYDQKVKEFRESQQKDESVWGHKYIYIPYTISLDQDQKKGYEEEQESFDGILARLKKNEEDSLQ